MEIRQENQSDYETVYKIIKEAFATAEQSDGNEQDLVVALRNSRAFIPELSLVAVEDKNVIGHILFTKAKVGKNTVLALAPLSVHPVHPVSYTHLFGITTIPLCTCQRSIIWAGVL